jgi:hypothetical protein
MKYSANYVEAGAANPKLKGNSFYMGVGQVDLYRYGMGGLERTGQVADIAVAIQVDPDSGLVQRLVTMQPKSRDVESGSPEDWQNNAAVAGSQSYALGDLKGGIVLNDFQPYPHWLDAIDGMQKALWELDPKSSPSSHEVTSANTDTFLLFCAATIVGVFVVDFAATPAYYNRHDWH